MHVLVWIIFTSAGVDEGGSLQFAITIDALNGLVVAIPMFIVAKAWHAEVCLVVPVIATVVSQPTQPSGNYGNAVSLQLPALSCLPCYSLLAPTYTTVHMIDYISLRPPLGAPSCWTHWPHGWWHKP